MTGYICSPPVYEYKGWLFEAHYNSGPWPLRKDGVAEELRAIQDAARAEVDRLIADAGGDK